MRVCGDCALCCSLPPIPEVDFIPNKMCKKYNCENHSCSIYTERPKACKEFTCLWLDDTTVPDSFRPDKIHMFFEKVDNYNIYLCMEDYQHIGIHRKYMNFILGLNSKGYSVLVSSFTMARKYLYVPEGGSPQMVIDQIQRSMENL